MNQNKAYYAIQLQNKFCNYRLKLFFSCLLLAIFNISSFSVNRNGKKLNNRFYLSAYNFGSLGKLAPKEQLQILNRFGYKGVILNSETKEDSTNIQVFINEAKKIKGFSVQAVMARYNFLDSRKENWKAIVDKIAGNGIQLWLIFGAKKSGITDRFIEAKLKQIVDYSAKRKVVVVLYPHSSCYIATAEQALPFVEKINKPNLQLAVHLCHEIRAGNGNRMTEVFNLLKGRIGAVTLAGTDSIPDTASALSVDLSTIKPIGTGNYDLSNFIFPLLKSKYKGLVGFINFKIEDDPETYLSNSINVWKSYLIK